MRLLTLACCVRAEAGAGTPPRATGQCLSQLFHESGSRWSIEGLGGLGRGMGGQGPPRAWPDPRAATSQSAAGSSGRGPGLGPRTDRKSHSSPPSLGPGLGIGVKSHPLKEEPRRGAATLPRGVGRGECLPGSCPWGHRLRGPGQQRGSWTLQAAASRPQGSRCLWPSSLSPSAVSSPAHSTLPTDAIREDGRDGSSDFFPKGPKDSSRMFSKGPRGTSGGLRALGAGGRRASWAAGVRRGRGLRGPGQPLPFAL